MKHLYFLPALIALIAPQAYAAQEFAKPEFSSEEVAWIASLSEEYGLPLTHLLNIEKPDPQDPDQALLKKHPFCLVQPLPDAILMPDGTIKGEFAADLDEDLKHQADVEQGLEFEQQGDPCAVLQMTFPRSSESITSYFSDNDRTQVIEKFERIMSDFMPQMTPADMPYALSGIRQLLNQQKALIRDNSYNEAAQFPDENDPALHIFVGTFLIEKKAPTFMSLLMHPDMVDVYARNKRGQTALEYARHRLETCSNSRVSAYFTQAIEVLEEAQRNNPPKLAASFVPNVDTWLEQNHSQPVPEPVASPSPAAAPSDHDVALAYIRAQLAKTQLESPEGQKNSDALATVLQLLQSDNAKTAAPHKNAQEEKE